MAHGADSEDTKNVFTTTPPQPMEKKPGQLTDEMIRQYFEQVGDIYMTIARTEIKDATKRNMH
jgi:hypothetical protein